MDYKGTKRKNAEIILTKVVTQQSTSRQEWIIPDSVRNTTCSGRDVFIAFMQAHGYLPSVEGVLYRRTWLEQNAFVFDEKSLCSDEQWMPETLCLANRCLYLDTSFYFQLIERPTIHQVDQEGGIWAAELFYTGNRLWDFADRFTTFDQDQVLKSWLLTNALRHYTVACRIITAIRMHGVFKLPAHRMHFFSTIAESLIQEAAERCYGYYKMAAAWEQEYLLWENNPCDSLLSNIPRRELKNKRIILIYNNPGWQDYTEILEKLPSNYILTLDRKYLDQAFAVVFHLPGLYEHVYDDLEKRDGQVWIRWNMEPDCNFKWMQQLNQLDIFDFRMDYHPNSDIVCPYYGGFHPDRIISHPDPYTLENKICMLISSSVHPSGREEYLEELMKYTAIDSYGRILKNCVMEEDKGWESKIALYSRYKFVIAFENSIQADYVTEKLYDPLLAGVVPIYLGAPNIDEYLPGQDCIIRADQFESPKALARYIEQCYSDRHEYMKYHQWRIRPWNKEFVAKVAIQDENPFIRLCHLLDSRYP